MIDAIPGRRAPAPATAPETRAGPWLRMGLAAAVLFVGGLGVWMWRTTIAGAVVAAGTVVVEGNTKAVQHKEGGIVQAIHVREGDRVAAGDLLLRLDETLPRANLQVIAARRTELLLQEARLLAERDGRVVVALPDLLLDAEEPPLAALDGQQALLEARQASLAGQKAQLAEQVTQLEQQIEGLAAQRAAKSTEYEVVAADLVEKERLFADGLAVRAQISELRRMKAQLVGARGDLVARIAEARTAISERRVRMLGVDEERQENILHQLQEVRAEIARVTEQEIAARDERRRTEIRAPLSGTVHQLAVHTTGGVAHPGEVLMRIVPGTDRLIVEARLRPVDVDQVRPGQPARLVLPAFDPVNTPELHAGVRMISPDLQYDELTGTPFYIVHLTLAAGETDRLKGRELLPGMPVDVYITTENRTVLDYLLKPLTNQMRKMLRES